MSAKRNHAMRYLLIAVVFCLVIVIYLGRLFYIQISGREGTYRDATTKRTVTVQAMRGEIYDRNGKKLVSNRYTYDLTLSHASFSELSAYRKNQVCLSLLGALDTCFAQDAHEETYFPLNGMYPYYYFSDAARDGDSPIYYRMQRVLGDLGMKKDAGMDALVEHYVENYQLLETDNSGNRLFDDAEVDRLIRLYYDMDALRFSAVNDYVFAADLDRDSALIPYVSELGLAAVNFTAQVERVYEYPGYASHILGTVGPIYAEEWTYYDSLGYQMNAVVGKDGCEAAFESYLRGADGKMEIEVDAAGNVVSSVVKEEPVAGSDVWLTIDIDLQIAAEDALSANVDYVVSRSTDVGEGKICNAGAAVAMDPKTFDVLAVASYPTFDLSTYHDIYGELSADPAKPLINRALNGAYTPGSTLKLGVAIAALMDGQVTTSETVECTGRYKNTMNCTAHTASTYVGVTEAIAVSCNSFFAEMGNRLGITKLEQYLSKFGIGQPTGLELGGTSGILAGDTYWREVRRTELWMPGNTWQAAIGQSDHAASPLQLACYVSTLVNGGTRYTAHLLSAVYSFGESAPDAVFAQTDETVLDRIAIPAAARVAVLNGMRDVVTSHANIDNWMRKVPVAVGGKTGTAQISSTDPDDVNAVFVCAAPFDDPEIVVSVVLEHGVAGAYSAFTASEILSAYYK